MSEWDQFHIPTSTGNLPRRLEAVREDKLYLCQIVWELIASGHILINCIWPYSVIVLGFLKQNDAIIKNPTSFPIGKQTVSLTDLNANFHYCD